MSESQVVFKRNFLIILFIGSAGSSLLCELCSGCVKWGLLSDCGVQASHCGGFSCWGAQGLELMGFSSCGL